MINLRPYSIYKHLRYLCKMLLKSWSLKCQLLLATKNKECLEKFDFYLRFNNALSVFVKFIMYQLLIDLHDYAVL